MLCCGPGVAIQAVAPVREWWYCSTVFQSTCLEASVYVAFLNPGFLGGQVRGFYVYYDDQKIHDTVESWDVTKLLISKNKPHLDKTTSLRFWEVLDEHTKAMHNDLNL